MRFEVLTALTIMMMLFWVRRRADWLVDVSGFYQPVHTAPKPRRT
jgi:hypothetical protein